MSTNYPLTLLYDASCPVCSLEMDHLRECDARGLLRFIDIGSDGFDAAACGTTIEALNAEIHGVRPDGSVLRGVEVLRLAYEAAGIGWVLRPTGWPVLRPAFDVAYRVFARHRHAISRATAPLIDVIRTRRARRVNARMRFCASASARAGAACEVSDNRSGRSTPGSAS